MLVKKKAILTVARMWQDHVHTRFMDSLVNMLLFSQEKLIKDPSTEYIHYVAADHSYHETARNALVAQARGEYLFMLDCDHCFAPDLLIRMLNTMTKHNIDVLSGIYQYKRPPHMAVGGIFEAVEGTDQKKIMALTDWDDTKEIIPVGVVPGGCLLVKMSVFKRINEELKQGPFDKIPNLSEDYSFSARCAKLDIPVYLAPQIECHHLITTPLYVSDYLKDIRQNGAQKV